MENLPSRVYDSIRVALNIKDGEELLRTMLSSLFVLFGFVPADLSAADVVLIQVSDENEISRLGEKSGYNCPFLVIADSPAVARACADNNFETLERPFGFDSLKEKIINLATNSSVKSETEKLNFADGTISIGGKSLRLTPIEYSIAKMLIAHRGSVVSRSDIKNAVCGGTVSNSVDVHLCSLRRKFRDVLNIEIITVSGKGIKLP